MVFVYSKGACLSGMCTPALIPEAAGESEKHTVLAGEKLDTTTPGQCSTFQKSPTG